MALRTIVTEGDPILRKKCRPVDEVSDRIRMILDDMVDTMRDAQGVGLAAPQVGIMRRMFVAEPDPEADPKAVYCFVNPEILSAEGEEEGEEACLSVPEMYGRVLRPSRITIAGLDREGNRQEHAFEGFAARVMCHEYDHLEGILYSDRAEQMFRAGEESGEDGEDRNE